MALKRHEKETFVEALRGDFAKSQHAILVDFRGITVPAVTEFRRKIRLSGGRYTVIKNTLAVRALEGTPLAKLKDKFIETTAIAYCDNDPVALAKRYLDGADIVLVEGFKAAPLPKVEIWRKAVGGIPLVHEPGAETDRWLALITDDKTMKAPCYTLHIQDTMWMNILVSLVWDGAKVIPT